MNTAHLIGIHGLANKPEASVLTNRWLAAIQEGLRRNQGGKGLGRFSFDLVYWADLRLPNRSPEGPNDRPNFYEPHPGTGPLPEYRESWLDAVETTVRGIGGSLADFVGRTAGRGLISDDLLTRIEDLDFYYRDEPFRTRLRGRLATRLTAPAGQKLIVVGHSMGSIIAMDVLRAQARPVDCLITLGSPLGLPYIVYRQKQEFLTVQTPEGVRRWVNQSEKRDRICFDPHLRDDYRPNLAGVRVEDDLVINTVENDRHQAFGYLRTPEFSRLLVSLIDG